MYELTKQFRFDAAHTLERDVDAAGSRRIHGHSYRAQVTLRGRPDPATGMIVDTGELARRLERARSTLDHRFLDEVEGLGPGTLENLAAFVWRTLAPETPALHSVTVVRDSTAERVTYFGGDPA